MRRRFNGRERVALYLSSDGRCERCGRELEPGWHADHVHPYSKSGPTDVINGAALCPTCNQMKGNSTMKPPRAWQQAAFAAAMASPTCLIEAAPATGKTRLALDVAVARLRRDVERIVWVVPSDSLRRQTAEAADQHGLVITADFRNGAGTWSTDFVGAVTTYQQVTSAPALWRRKTSECRTLVVLDEVHHCSDENAWGPAIEEAFSPAGYRLLLSGTPFRHDGRPIPWISYDSEGHAEPRLRYGYREAVADGVVRPVRFDILDANVRWRDVTDLHDLRLEDVSPDDEGAALRTALDPLSGWVEGALRRADDELSRGREDYPHLAGICIASDIASAERLAVILQNTSGEQPVVVHQHSTDPSGAIARFATSTKRWLVAVNMVSEGVDIPRLGIGVYATNIRTDLRFWQMVGRTTRTVDSDDAHIATWVIPSAPGVQALAQRFAHEADAGLADADEMVEREEREATERADGLFVPLGADDVRHVGSLLHGDRVSPALIAQIEALRSTYGLHDNAAVLARLFEALGTPIEAPPTGPASQPSTDARRRQLKRRIAQLVGRLAYRFDAEPKHVNFALKQVTGTKRDQATELQLEQQLSMLAAAVLCDSKADVEWLW